MGAIKKRTRKKAPAGGSPLDGGRPKPGASSRTKGKPKRGTTRNYTLEERLAAVEAYLKSGLTLVEFGKVWGISNATIGVWVRKYEKGGPKALERKPHAGKGKSRLGTALKTEIVRAKLSFPHFGFKRIRDYLCRFRGIKVSPGAIKKTLQTTDDKLTPPAAKKKRKTR